MLSASASASNPLSTPLTCCNNSISTSIRNRNSFFEANNKLHTKICVCRCCHGNRWCSASEMCSYAYLSFEYFENAVYDQIALVWVWVFLFYSVKMYASRVEKWIIVWYTLCISYSTSTIQKSTSTTALFRRFMLLMLIKCIKVQFEECERYKR